MRYRVTLVRQQHGYPEVEADTPEEAQQMALGLDPEGIEWISEAPEVPPRGILPWGP